MSIFSTASTVISCHVCEKATDELACLNGHNICKECSQTIVAVFARRRDTENGKYYAKETRFR